MSEETAGLPALASITDAELQQSGLPSSMEMSPGLAIFFNDKLYARCKSIATVMANARGVMPKHLIGCPEACFAIVSRAIVWKLDPFSVAMSTFQTPNGAIGYEGKLIQAIIENSGRLDPVAGGVKFEHFGDWGSVHKKFKIIESPKGGKYPSPTWTEKDAKDLYVVVSAQLRGETTPRTLRFDLLEAFPLNSPLWATAPNRQICYTAVRAFGNLTVPQLILGVPFDIDPTGFYGEPMTDVTPPRPSPAKTTGFERQVADQTETPATSPATSPPAEQDDRPQAEHASEQTPEPELDTGHNGPQKADIGPQDGENGQQGPEAEVIEETPLQRGKRLLATLTQTNEIADLRLSIQDELEAEFDGKKGLDAVLVVWRKACDARSIELTTAPNRKDKKK